jgi:hypothetical protein
MVEICMISPPVYDDLATIHIVGGPSDFDACAQFGFRWQSDLAHDHSRPSLGTYGTGQINWSVKWGVVNIPTAK